MGEPVYKLAGQYALYLVRQELAPLVEPIQLSLSPGGSERAVHVLQAAIETGGHDSIIVKTDFRNAFNTIKRATLLGEMFKAPSLSRIWRFVYWAYKAPSALLLMDQGTVVGELPSSEGVRQGDVLGASLFALAVQPLFSRCVRDLPTVKALAILDDFELEGPPKDVLAAFKAVSSEAKACGLELVVCKSKALWPRQTSPQPEIVAQVWILV